MFRVKILNSLSFISVINFLTLASAQELCAKLTLKGASGRSIEVPEISNAAIWPKLHKNNYNENVVNISLENSKGYIRLCYFNSTNKDPCEYYDSESLARTNRFNYDVNRLYSVLCTNKKNGNGLCGGQPPGSCIHQSNLKKTAILQHGTCATLFQDEDCNECNFPSVPLDVKESIHEFTVITSLKIAKEGYSVMAKYRKNDGNTETCLLSQSGAGQHNKKCFKNLMQKAVNFTCIANSNTAKFYLSS